MKRLVPCIILAACSMIFVAPAVPAQALTLTKPEKQLLALVNHVRVTHNLPKLTISTCLERASRAHSREMVRRDYFSHNSYNGESFSHRLIRFGFSQSGCKRWTAGEDIAYGYGSGGTAKAVFRAWMHSKPHRAVILDKRLRRVGVGRAKGTWKGIPDVVFSTLDCGTRILF